ncbi:glycosyl hydrolase 115 family protein [Pseudoduganella sp. LjRoot289]|uniref:glycosyl hydrolase 115 family protein n=1 Tax=Pseudoduganella sp. LjRoot289 TaxID=3342314 RepID=UPI003ED0E437
MINIPFRRLCLLLGLFACAPASHAGFELAGPAGGADIIHEDDATMRLSAKLLQRDVQAVSGVQAVTATRMEQCRRRCVVIGRFDSALVQRIAKEEGIDLSALKGGWERYQRVVFDSRRGAARQIMLIAGSDTRGTVYGVIDLTREMGVSAWEWWADVHPAQRKRIEVAAEAVTSRGPSVQYRGVFLNDEDWGLQPWAAKRDPAKDIGPETYSRIFELLWRLKANIIWPAMHDSTKPFYQIPGNARMARDYAIVMGTSHAEPMMRNNVREWDKRQGAFNFFTNRDALVSYWDQRVNEVKQFENIYSVGIRGVHDSAMEGADTVAKQLEGTAAVIDVQRQLLSAAQGKPAEHIPQALTLYKEVLDIYKAGLQVRDDITLVWPDDNYGYMHQLSTPQEARRGGGAGLYYHLSYWGRPHDYLWLGTTHPALIRDQLERATVTGTNKVWIANVGDIKPLEYLTQYFLDIAFDQKQLALSPRQHLTQWLSAQFDAGRAEEIADILLGYYDLAWERRPEFMGFSQTEPTTVTRQTDYMQSGGEEAEQRLAKYAALVRRAEAVHAALPAAQRDAYFQLVLYPVRASANLNARILKQDLAAQLARAGRPAAERYARQAERAQRAIAEDTRTYNQGKWQGMMDAAPRRLPVFEPPVVASYGKPVRKDCVVAYPAPLSAWSDRLAFTTGRAETKTITLVNYGAGAVRWKATAVPDGYALTPNGGELDGANGYEQRIQVRYDGKAKAGRLGLECGAAMVEANLALTPGAGELLPTEHDRIVALPSASAKATAGWTVSPGLGSYGASMRSDLQQASVDLSAAGTRPPLEYDFVSHTQSAARLKFVTVPAHALTSANGVRLAYSLDDSPLQLLDFETFGRSDEWKHNTLSNTAVRVREVRALVPGRHRLKVYALDPGVVLDRIEVAFDGAPQYYGKALQEPFGSGQEGLP